MIHKTHFSLTSTVYITTIKYTYFMQDVLKTLLHGQALSVCLCKVKGDLHVGANFTKVCNVNAAIFIGVIPI